MPQKNGFLPLLAALVLALPVPALRAQYPPPLRPFPPPVAPLVLTDDGDRVLAGALVTRVVSLEDPERAVPVATKPDRPLEFQVPPGRDPLEEARERGRPFLVFRMGQREFSPEEIAQQTVP